MSRHTETWIGWIENESEEINPNQRKVCKKVLEAVEKRATSREVDQVGEAIREYVEETGDLPPAKEAKRFALHVCHEGGHDVTNGYLVR